MYRVEIKACSGHPNQYGDCELCNRKITTQTYTVGVFVIALNPITNKQVQRQKSYSFTCFECSEKLKEKYKI